MSAFAAAPLVVDRAVVEPIWRRLEARAETLGLEPVAGTALVEEPNLRLVTENGLEITPSLVDGRSYAFVMPGGVKAMRLRSRAARPSDTIGRFVDDRRELEIRVGRISISAGSFRQSYNTHLVSSALSGWHGLEAGAIGRWTNGDASLRLDPRHTRNQPVFLDIEVLAAGPYMSDGMRQAA